MLHTDVVGNLTILMLHSLIIYDIIDYGVTIKLSLLIEH